MTDFYAAGLRVIELEGGYVNDPVDPGGETKYGISKRSYPDIDIKGLTRNEALAIYRRDWWERYEYDLLENQELAEKVLEASVNMGSRRAHKLLQRALRSTGHRVAEDGKLGPETFGAVWASDPDALTAAYRSELAGWYRHLARARPELKRFERGWLRRAYS